MYAGGVLEVEPFRVFGDDVAVRIVVRTFLAKAAVLRTVAYCSGERERRDSNPRPPA